MLEISLKPNQKKSFRKRIYFLFSFFFLILIFLLSKIAMIQVVDQKRYERYAKGQTLQRLPERAPRGEIIDIKGTKIVYNDRAYTLKITPAYFPKDNDEERVERKRLLRFLAMKLAEDNNDYFITLSPEQQQKLITRQIKNIERKITITNSYRQNKFQPVIISRDVKEKLYISIRELQDELRGVEVETTPIRRYKFGESLSHVLGYTGMIKASDWERYQKKYEDNRDANPYKYKDTIIGKWGLEKHQDPILRGIDGVKVLEVNSIGKPIEGSEKIKVKPRPGKNIQLTINMQIQEIAKKTMRNRRGAILVSNPSTGEILAFVSNPSFDSNKLITGKQADYLSVINKKGNALFNRMLQGRYPPSSIFKVVGALTALENGIDPEKKYFRCNGQYKLGTRIFKCHGHHGKVNLNKAIRESCNSYFYQLVLELGWKKFYKYAKMFGLGIKYRLESGTSQVGILPNDFWKRRVFEGEEWYTGDSLNAVIGQGYFLVPPIQVHNIMSAIANDGKLMKLHLVKKIIDPQTNEAIQETKPTLLKEITMKQETLETIQKALRDVVENGTARRANRMKHHMIAGKTGTAQNIMGQPPHAWFSCYAPYDAPPEKRIVITVIVENIEGGGGRNAAPKALAIFKHIFEGKDIADVEKEEGFIIEEIESNEDSKITNVATDDLDDSSEIIIELADMKYKENAEQKLTQLRENIYKINVSTQEFLNSKKEISFPKEVTAEKNETIVNESKPDKKELHEKSQIDEAIQKSKEMKELETKKAKERKEKERKQRLARQRKLEELKRKEEQKRKALEQVKAKERQIKLELMKKKQREQARLEKKRKEEQDRIMRLEREAEVKRLKEERRLKQLQEKAKIEKPPVHEEVKEKNTNEKKEPKKITQKEKEKTEKKTDKKPNKKTEKEIREEKEFQRKLAEIERKKNNKPRKKTERKPQYSNRNKEAERIRKLIEMEEKNIIRNFGDQDLGQ